MHPKNRYLSPPDFTTYSSTYPPLSKYLNFKRNKVTGLKDWKDPEAIRALTCAILWTDWGLRLEIPVKSLVPRIPARLDYILIIHDLLHLAVQQDGLAYNKEHSDLDSSDSPRVLGLDIGTGASSIYPLLGCTKYPNWSFIALDINSTSLEYAQSNIERNSLSHRITLINTSNAITNRKSCIMPRKLLKKHIPPSHTHYDFCMCNPPFYRSLAQIAQQTSFKANTPHSVSTGEEGELITCGGEVAFVQRMAKESVGLRKVVGWFTSLVGRKSDVDEIVDFLKNGTLAREGWGLEVRVERMSQGFTVRWVVAWRWMRGVSL